MAVRRCELVLVDIADHMLSRWYRCAPCTPVIGEVGRAPTQGVGSTAINMVTGSLLLLLSQLLHCSYHTEI